MSDASDRKDALTLLKTYVQDGIIPTLTPADLDAILDNPIRPLIKRASMWLVNTAYNFGDIILPSVKQGHRYRCTVAGTSDPTTEPLWPKTQGSTITETVIDTQGNVLTWQEFGPDFQNIYDVRLAAYRGWMLKAAKASKFYNVRLGGQQFDREQLYQHCLQQAAQFAPFAFG